MSEQSKTKKGLTKRQREVFNFIKTFIDKQHFSPSYREIMQHFGFTSTASVFKHIKALERKGLLTLEAGNSRSLSYTEEQTPTEQKDLIELPFMGILSAGMPITTFSQIKSMSIPKTLVTDPSQCYVLKVLGDGLSEELLMDGDLIIVEAREQADPGETVIGRINQEEESIIKQYFPEGQYLKLVSNDKNHPPLILRSETFSIQGVIGGMIRTYH